MHTGSQAGAPSTTARTSAACCFNRCPTGAHCASASLPCKKPFKLALTTPKELGGAGGAGTHPEQLCAAGSSACFIGAMKAVAGRMKLNLPAQVSIKASVGIGPMTGKAGAFGIEVAMEISVPGMERGALEQPVAPAHEVCPYSNATRGNIEVKLNVP